MKLQRTAAALLLAASPFLMGADRSCVRELPADSIVVESAIPVSGFVLDESSQRVAAQVELRVNGVSQGLVDADLNGDFIYPSVPLALGRNVLTGTTQRLVDGQLVTGSLVRQLVTRRDDLLFRGRQDVCFEYTPLADQRLDEIANGSLAGAPFAPEALTEFRAAVKGHIDQIFDRIYAPFDVRRIASCPVAGDVVRVRFEDADPVLAPNAFGTSFDLLNLAASVPDFNNQIKQQTVRVFVGRFKQLIVDDGQLLSETPATLADAPSDRARQVARGIARTAAHEVGHTLGLVLHTTFLQDLAAELGIPVQTLEQVALSLGLTLPLPDLEGCQTGHNCPDVDLADSAARRFNRGFFVMDAGPGVETFARFGFGSRTNAQEVLAGFNSFNTSYLRILHPKP